jgi:DNA-directed RNA polymerase sigma subunit (sigma70/sigma32)
VRRLSVADGGESGWWYSYTHFEPTEVTERMLEVRYDRGLAMEMPIEVEPGGSMVFTLVGPEGAFAEAVRADAPEYELEVLETGEHTPAPDDLFLSLTERQREVLEAAVGLDYYDDPRAATHEDIAREVDTAPSTIGEHPRKVESRVFAQLVR